MAAALASSACMQASAAASAAASAGAGGGSASGSAQPSFLGLKPSRRGRRLLRRSSSEVSSSAPEPPHNLLSKAASEAVEEENEAPAESAASTFLADVASLIKLVDSRDIVELELKHLDYELLIRKKEALPPPPQPAPSSFPGPHVMAHTPFAYGPPPSPPAPPLPAAEPVSAEPPAAPTPPSPVAAGVPPMLSPMAGTFYRSPGPGEPAFVKVGDKIQKGQVLCIVEAMKLMNEIEADQSGTIVEILAEDRKPVSIETPLFVIKP